MIEALELESLNRICLYVASTTQGGINPEELSLVELMDYFFILQADQAKAEEEERKKQGFRELH